MTFRLTYASMFDPPEALHQGFERALARAEEGLGARQRLFIDGRDQDASNSFDKFSPIDRDLRLGVFAQAGGEEVDQAMRAAARAFPAWRATAPERRCELVRQVGALIEERVYEIAAALTLEVGKNRLEALAEAQEAADFFAAYADDFERSHGFDRPLPDDPIPGVVSRNRSVLRPYGPWVVIAPFNFPLALAAGPTAAALVTGNTVVLKGATDTPWAGRLLADCIRDAGLPAGVFNYLTGPGGAVGQAMVDHCATAGLTFTGSAEVGMALARRMIAGPIAKPCIAELGGKNPCIVTAKADLEVAAAGVTRSAFGMGGQKCSALSRLYVERPVAAELIEAVRQRTAAIAIGDPRVREAWLGPVINARAHEAFSAFADELRAPGCEILNGGGAPQISEVDKGFYVEPLFAKAPLDHPLWRQEMFLPILMVHEVADRDEALRLANDTDMGLTAGFYGGADEIDWFQEGIEAGVTYANRPQGATTGAWPGYQPFGGWKGSTSTGKGIASFYYLPLYMREQSRTVVEA